MTPEPRRRFSTFRTALWLGIAYLAVLLLVVAFPTGRGSVNRVTTLPSATPQDGPASRAVCGIDHVYDAKTGRCVYVNATPLPCVQGSNFDSKAGFCMPVAQKVAPPTDAGNVFPPGIVREPRAPTIPGFGNNDQSQYNPFGNSQP